MIILGVETSCDETAAAIIEVKQNKIKVLSNIVSSQIKLHKKWGGVVPNLAAREHLKNILSVIDACLKEAGKTPAELDLLTVTNGPGLIPALLIGANAVKTLAYVWKKPLIGIHHIEGHIYANFIGNKISGISNFKFQISNFPILCLVVSGGHTQLVLMKKHLDYKIIGQTLDDAAGEAFDKVARILGLGYPGGPAISQQAAKWKSQITNHKSQKNSKFKIQNSKFSITLPRPMINKNNFDFSFSGLKTAVLYTVKKNPQILKNKKLISRLCAEFQQAVIDVLIHKTLKAAQKYKPKTIMLAGGVSANQELRKQLGGKIKKELKNTLYMIPDTLYCIDNAAMIAIAGHFRWQKIDSLKRKNALKNWAKIKTDANLKL